MSHAFDSKALELSRKTMGLMYGPMPVGGSCQLQAQIQSLFIEAMEFATPAVQAEQLSGNTEQVSQTYTLPECFERLFKHAQGLTFGNDWNRGTAAKYHRDLLIKAVDDCRAAIASGNSPAIPDGYALVPVEPTDLMVEAMVEAMYRHQLSMRGALKAAISAAPQQEDE